MKVSREYKEDYRDTMYKVQFTSPDGYECTIYYKDEATYLAQQEEFKKYEESEEYKESERRILYGKL